MIDPAGHNRTSSSGYGHGIAWSPAGDQFWFSAARNFLEFPSPFWSRSITFCELILRRASVKGASSFGFRKVTPPALSRLWKQVFGCSV